MSELAARLPRRRRAGDPARRGACARVPRCAAPRSSGSCSAPPSWCSRVRGVARREPRPADASRSCRGHATVVVLDQSKSIYAAAYKRIARRSSGSSRGRPDGLVAFSDTAYEMLPPGARGTDLKPMLRFYAPTKTGQTSTRRRASGRARGTTSFSRGTKISSGLNLALVDVPPRPRQGRVILLVSDLQTAADDQPALAQALHKIQQDRGVAEGAAALPAQDRPPVLRVVRAAPGLPEAIADQGGPDQRGPAPASSGARRGRCSSWPASSCSLWRQTSSCARASASRRRWRRRGDPANRFSGRARRRGAPLSGRSRLPRPGRARCARVGDAHRG